MDSTIQEKVKNFYGDIAKQVSEQSGCSCRGSSCCANGDNASLFYNPETLNDLPPEAILASLGCANPLVFAQLQPGETVLDLGSGGGIDVFIAAKSVGPSGKVYGLDMTDEMLLLANTNKEKMGITNVKFLKGYIEDLPLPEGTIDVIISNCVINLSENKTKVLSEAYRVLKYDGRLAIADIVVLKEVPAEILTTVELWAECIAGALPIQEYRDILQSAGFRDISIEPVHPYTREAIEGLIAYQPHRSEEPSPEFLDLVDGAFAGALVKAWK
ncbi:MAG: arsenite methyltransferase [Candidatus Atribacteria bacterium]|nr:arsenite methyltransferase [Candidatus Atribacteria bacterium]